jgi:hypothetical protein
MRDNRLLLMKLIVARKIVNEVMENPSVSGEVRERLGIAKKLIDDVFDMLS